jgi:hypothetical protein
MATTYVRHDLATRQRYFRMTDADGVHREERQEDDGSWTELAGSPVRDKLEAGDPYWDEVLKRDVP